MKGLVLKDLYSLKSYVKVLSFIIIFLITVWSVSKSYSGAIFIIAFMIMSISVRTFSYDEVYNWDSFAVTLSLSSTHIVGSKYISTILINALGFLFCSLYCFLVIILGGDLTVQDSLLYISVCILMCSFFISFILPLSYRFGSQKMKILILAILGIPALTIVLLQKLFPNPNSLSELENVGNIFLENGFLAFISSILIGALLLSLSYIISLRIFKNKQF